MDLIVFYIIYVYLFLFFLACAPLYENILHGFPTSLSLYIRIVLYFYSKIMYKGKKPVPSDHAILPLINHL